MPPKYNPLPKINFNWQENLVEDVAFESISQEVISFLGIIHFSDETLENYYIDGETH